MFLTYSIHIHLANPASVSILTQYQGGGDDEQTIQDYFPQHKSKMTLIPFIFSYSACSGAANKSH